MARSANADVLEKYRFAVSWSDDGSDQTAVEVAGDEITVNSSLLKAGFTDVQMPKRTTNKVQYREGLDPDIYSLSAGLSSMEDIVLSRGLVPNAAIFSEFSSWAQKVHASGDTTNRLDYSIDRSTRPATGDIDYRKEMTIVMFDRAGVVQRAWKLYGAFPVSYVPGSDLNANEDGEKSLEQLTLAYEDFLEILPDANVFPADENPAVNS